MKNVSRHTGTLRIIERMKSSPNGNPRYKCFLDSGNGNGIVFITAPDSSYGYSITNHRDKEITVTVGTHYGKTTLDTIE